MNETRTGTRLNEHYSFLFKGEWYSDEYIIEQDHHSFLPVLYCAHTGWALGYYADSDAEQFP